LDRNGCHFLSLLITQLNILLLLEEVETELEEAAIVRQEAVLVVIAHRLLVNLLAAGHPLSPQ